MPAIHWLSDISGDFETAADWSGGVMPGASDNAVLKPNGSPYTVTADASETVKSIQLAANATLHITGGTFTARTGTGRGANAGTIVVGAGATLVVGGALDNTGGITLQGTSQTTASLLLTSDTTLSGGGTVTLGGGAGGSDLQMINAAAGAGTVTLTNVDNTISGSGTIVGYGGGAQSLVLFNQSAGVIGSGAGNAQEILTLGPSQGSGVINTVINDGSIEGGNGVSIRIYNTIISGVGGVISEDETSLELPSYVSIDTCTIVGQTLATESRLSSIGVEDSSVTIGGNIQNAGGISLLSSNLELNENVTLSGGGSFGFQTLPKGPISVISGTEASIVLTNVDNRIAGEGDLGGGKLTLVNESGGALYAFGGKLTIDTGTNTILNAGLIEILEAGKAGVAMLIRSPIDNTGVIADAYAEAGKNTLTVDGAVTGAGEVTIAGGTVDFKSSFSQNVTFTSTIGILELAQSQAYTASITGFSTTGGTSLDLRDIGFVSAGEASFSGTTTSGVLTVTDGTHTAHITLDGDYSKSGFTCSSDGHGGTIVIDPSDRPPALATPTSPHALASAMAALAPAPAAIGAPAHQAWRDERPTLVATRGQLV